MSGEIYIGQTRDAIWTNSNVYKVGRTGRTSEVRAKEYLKGYVLLYNFSVIENVKSENIIKKEFKKIFKHRPDYGDDYFEGDPSDMAISIINLLKEQKLLLGMINSSQVLSDHLYKFFTIIKLNAGKIMTIEQLYNYYLLWCTNNNIDNPLSEKKLKKRIEAKYGSAKKDTEKCISGWRLECIKKYQTNDMISLFIEDKLIRTDNDNDYMTITQLYSCFTDWCNTNNYKSTNKIEFSNRIKELLGEKKGIGPKNNRRVGWKNIKIEY